VPYTERGVPVSAKVLRYAQRLVEQYDTNHNGQLEKEEWQKMRGNPAVVDRDHDGLITVDDLARYITIYGRYRHVQLIAPALMTNPPQPAAEGPQPPATESPRSESPAGPAGRNAPGVLSAETPPAAAPLPPATAGPAAAAPAEAASPTTTTGSQPLTPAPSALPAVTPRTAAGQRFFVPPARRLAGAPPWFIARDLDGDGQLTLSEFAPQATQADIEEFNRYDTNHDGVITVDEVLKSGKPAAEGRGTAAAVRGKSGATGVSPTPASP
jgi:Ca2+-binding EF-hand superfamily protein